MRTGTVSGEVSTSRRIDALGDSRLVLVHADTDTGAGSELVAVALIDARCGERVLLAPICHSAGGDAPELETLAVVAVVESLEREDTDAVERHPVLKKKAVTRPKRSRRPQPEDETMDLFAQPSGPHEQQAHSPETGDGGPGIDDVDSIWGEFEEEEESRS